MNKYIVLRFYPVGITIKARLLYKLNPGLCEILTKALPYKSVQCHALVAGQQLYHYTPIVEAITYKAETKEDKTKQPIGRINMSSLELLSIKYGVITEYLTSVPVAQVVDEDIEKLKKIGSLAWESVYKTKKIINVSVSLEGQNIPKDYIGLRRPKVAVSNKDLEDLVNRIYDECEFIWMTPPKDLMNIHKGKIKSEAGSYNQYFSTMVFVNGEVRQLGYNAFGGLLKSFSNQKISLRVAKELPQPFSEVAAGFLGYCGLEKLNQFTQEALIFSKKARSKKELTQLYNALCIYANRLHGWSLHYFPWKHGKNYQFRLK
ncbi:MAG: hypothetical protein HYS68_01955 [Candidatus Levybacteria bacterium]|nr:hypothetical protein [Candidatus Levybacteria bacterium]